MRKQVLIASLSVALLLVAGAASAADVLQAQQVSARAAGGNVPAALLADMGLEGMEVLSDQQGDEVRGSGFFFIFFFGVHHHHPHFYYPFFFYHSHHPFFHHHHHAHHGHAYHGHAY